MGLLQFALRTVSGVVLAADGPYPRTDREIRAIRNIENRFGVLIEPDQELGNRILDQAEDEVGEDGFANYRDVIERCAETGLQILQEQQEDNDTGVPGQTGLIFAGVDADADDQSVIGLHGIHTGRGYRANDFGLKVFGGHSNSIARYITERVATARLTMEQAKYVAAFSVYQSQRATGRALEPYISMAEVSYDRGFEWVEEDEMTEMLSSVTASTLRLGESLAELFLDAPGLDHARRDGRVIQ